MYGPGMLVSRMIGLQAVPVLLLLVSSCSGSEPTGPEGGGTGGVAGFAGLIDHNCTDIYAIPEQWITGVRNDIRVHYAHTSHGSQLTVGLSLLESDDPVFDVEIGDSFLPDAAGALCIFDGQEGETYITPDLFWESREGMDMTRAVLDGNPSINVCMWCWCSQMDYYGQGQVQAYLDSMSVLDQEFPAVTFVYMTGNAQNVGSEGYNRYLRNQQVRQFCEDNDKVLFDFADLDSWWYDPVAFQWDHSTYLWSGVSVPVEHDEFHGDEAGHTTYGSCRQKARAVWWMAALLEGWDGN